MNDLNEIRWCSINTCNKEAIRTYPMFNNKPSFMRIALCRDHSQEADESLEKRGLKNLAKPID